ncbi:methylenetetrahydrofolate reductase [Microbacteriaceae bacterium VKM Ac-2854]|nr:methylenetetrahydrofolate reductase [Microbacteriaceae bacterium VKM Ac-2854]
MTALRFEIIPAADIADRLCATFADPRDVTLTVTSLPKHGVERTLSTAIELAGHGFDVVPHLSAKSIGIRSALVDVIERMRAAGIREAFAVSGDGHPQSDGYASSLEMMRDLAEIDHGLSLGIAGYPEGHPAMSEEHLMQHLLERAPYVDKVITQMCFSTAAIGAYGAKLRAAGVGAQLWVGLPGAIARQRLITLSTRIGVGTSLGFLKRSSSVAGGLMRSRDFDPAPFIRELEAEPRLRAVGIGGLHVYSFNEVERLPATFLR